MGFAPLALARQPRSTTATSSWSSETDTATAIASTTTEIATTTISGVAPKQTTTTTESESAVETSVTVSTSAFETSTLESSTLESPTLELTTFQVSTSAAEASTHTTEDATTTTTSPAQSAQTPPNGDFEDATLAPWESTGTTAVLVRGLAYYQGNQCADLPGSYNGNTAKICQLLDIQQGYEYTFAAHLRQGCTYYSAGEGEDLDCDNNTHSFKLSIDGVFDSEAKPVSRDNQYHEYSNTFQYTGPSIDSIDLCVSVVINQGERYEFLVDSVSIVRGKSVPVPEEDMRLGPRRARMGV
ncbi:hypothetical protein J7337_002095 [Fusarium musae]|uniref:CBM-cenC domain-containing protein n=1 Tax=Fusarium musae TaxID=1042133 RepID=A0A9P8ITD3_9HYPO|nr:hypothetical protein J7337_002095 [Fusarium musae]KAG9505129.1 hypothetical protein J7337_002095 [Fusarium musae]